MSRCVVKILGLIKTNVSPADWTSACRRLKRWTRLGRLFDLLVDYFTCFHLLNHPPTQRPWGGLESAFSPPAADQSEATGLNVAPLSLIGPFFAELFVAAGYCWRNHVKAPINCSIVDQPLDGIAFNSIPFDSIKVN